MNTQTRTICKTYRIEPKNVCFIKFILESYEGVGQLTTLDSATGLILVRVVPGCEKDWDGLLEDLRNRIRIEAWKSEQ